MLVDHKSILRSLTITFFLAALVGSTSVAAQSGDDTSRGLGDLGFMGLRPAAEAKSAAPRKRPVYKPKKASPTAPDPKPDQTARTLFGVTLWRLRPSAKTDHEAARMLVQEEVTTTDDGVWTPERVDIDTSLVEGQHVRFAIETPRDGYLYVVDRELYADGTASPAYVIFPTTRTHGGNNKVAAGSVVEIPALSDDRAYFTVKRSRDDETAEEFSIIVSPEPLDGVTIERKPYQVTTAQLADWKQRWGGPTDRVDLVNGLGTVYTTAEKAGAEAALTQEDPSPQTIFRVAGRPGDPALVTFTLNYR